MDSDPKRIPRRPPIRVCQPRPREEASVEDALDALLDQHRKRESESQTESPTPEVVDPMETLRGLFAGELVPAVEALAEKYSGQGIELEMDAADLLGGGRGVSIEVRLGVHGLRLTGTVMPDRIAFEEARMIEGAAGALTSGGTLRTRELSDGRFREFVCEHISSLVRWVLRQRTPTA